jgi:hypothetical protein
MCAACADGTAPRFDPDSPPPPQRAEYSLSDTVEGNSGFQNIAGQRSVLISLVRSLEGFELGKAVLVRVRAGASPCDPIRWDAAAPCARIRFQAPRSGLLSVRLEQSDGEVDFTIMSGDGQQYLAYGGSGQSQFAEASVVLGQYYEIWVHSYYGQALVRLGAGVK